ncbi:MAG: acetyl-CoA hydrolase/transferase C-terminal domain-containing protein [Novosphingobium sp.]|nr:acetyl-CoA hydrolase/transferase C-terminal domain-containing protein [Novosphingobium sp.]
MTTSPRVLRSGELAAVLPPGGMTLVSSCSAESDLLAAEVAAAGAALGDMDFAGIFVPGLNRHGWKAGPASRVTTFFQTPELRARGAAARFLPLCYQDILALVRRERPRATLFMCAPPDVAGNCSFGTEVAFVAALWREIPVRIAHINPAMPRTPGDPGIPFAELTACYESAQVLRGMPEASSDPVSARIAANVASLVPDGATLQTGLGKIPDAVLRALSSHRKLRLHTGLVGDGALVLVRSGAMAPGASALVGVAIGSPELYTGLDDPHFQFRPVTVTHDPATLAAIEGLVTINSAMAVDLFGQVYSEASSRGFQSGPGGASDYARGARVSNGGLRIIALPAAAGPTSRIVAPGQGHGPVSLSRFDVDAVVTEHGAADLRGKTYPERAAALIAIASPDHREALDRAWHPLAAQI